MSEDQFGLLKGYAAIREAAAHSADGNRCVVTASPELREKLLEQFNSIRESMRGSEEEVAHGLASLLRFAQPRRVGFNDGLIIPGSYFPVGTPANVVRSTAANRAPLRGTVRVIVVLVDFSDRQMNETQQHFQELFFSTGVLANGSVKEYFTEVTHNLVNITGEVVGPYRLPQTLATYANGASGIGSASPNARNMARDAAVAADPDVNFGPYDNDGDGFVDAFIVIHAGPGGEVTGSPNDIWSHKWVLSGGEYVADTARIFAYLTVPEDARIGVCCHELGHLLFGWPDLYDTDGSSEGLGNWCLMAGGSWNGGGNVPAHPSAWCKADQGWVSVSSHSTNADVTIPDVKDSHEVHRLWKDGTPGSEYFLVENRQRDRYDADLPGGGLLIYHIDDALTSNSDETHYKVALEQADGNRDLENAVNRGNDGDPFPGSSNNRVFNKTSNPNSKSYAGADTCVAVTHIGDSGPVMTARFSIRCGKTLKFEKELRKDFKSEKLEKSELKEFKERKEIPDKGFFPDKRPEKPEIDKTVALDKNPIFEGKNPAFEKPTDKPGEGGFGRPFGRGEFAGPESISALEARVAALEQQLGAPQPFIGRELRPDLSRGALSQEDDYADAQKRMAEGDARSKRAFDTKISDR